MRIVSLLIGIVLVAAAVWILNDSLNLRRWALEATVEHFPCDGRILTEKDCRLRVIIPERLGEIRGFLVARSNRTLQLVLFTCCGVLGALVFYWYLEFQGDLGRTQAEWQPVRLISRFVIAGAFGAFTLAVLMIFPESNENRPVPRKYENLLLFPILAGLFIETFYRQLHDRLKKVPAMWGST